MKSLLIVVLIFIIGGAVWFTTKQTPKVEAPTTTETTTQTPSTTPTPNTTTADDMGMTAEEHAAMMGSTTKGTDVGMEMPIDDMAGMDHSKKDMTAPAPAKAFTLSGKNFFFDTSELRVKKGDKVTINFTSADGFHDVVIDEFSAKTERVKTGGTSSMTFVADKVGTFEYYCSVGQHRMNGMVGTLFVE